MTVEPPSDEAPPPQPPLLPPPVRARRGGAVLWVLILAALVVGIAGSSPYWLPLLEGAGDQRPDQTEARLTRLEAQARQAPAEPASVAPLRARVAALEARAPGAPDTAAVTDAAQKAAADAAQKLSARIDALEARVASVSAAATHGDPMDAAELAAVADLRAALAGSGPFADELAAVQALDGGDAALQPLAAAAKTGIPDRALLAQRFRAETANAIEAAETATTADAESDDFTERVLARLKGLVSIRRVDGAESASVPAVRAAETALDRGDLDGAIGALKPLGGTAADAARAFVADAQARLDAERAVAALEQRTVAHLAAGGTH